MDIAIECAECGGPIFHDRHEISTDPWGGHITYFCTDDCLCNAGEAAEERANERYYGGDCPAEVYERNANR